MSNEEIVTTATVIYDVRGIDRSIRSSQRLLYSINSIRLVLDDFKRLGEDPSFQNIMWTGIQLTRVWTNLHRMVKATNQAQRLGLTQGVARATGIGGGAGIVGGAGAGAAGGGLGGFIGLLGATLGALAFANPVTAALALTTLVISGTGYRRYFSDRKNRIERNEFIRNQREIAKSQGYEY